MPERRHSELRARGEVDAESILLGLPAKSERLLIEGWELYCISSGPVPAQCQTRPVENRPDDTNMMINCNSNGCNLWNIKYECSSHVPRVKCNIKIIDHWTAQDMRNSISKRYLLAALQRHRLCFNQCKQQCI